MPRNSFLNFIKYNIMTFTQPNETLITQYDILSDISTLKPNQLLGLIDKLKTESALLTERLELADFQKLIEQNLLTGILDLDQNIIATAMLWEVNGQPLWYEMGTVWVDLEHRGNKLGHTVFESITGKIPQGSSAFLLTTSPRIIHSAKTYGYTFIEKDVFEETKFAIEPPAELEHELYIFEQSNPKHYSKQIQNLRTK
jgi:hypothetical protein